MAAPNESTRKPIVVDDAMLRAFAKGQLDEAAEDRIVALLEERPELQEKVAAISTDGILSKMKAHREILASKSLSSQIGVGSSVSQSQQGSAEGAAQPKAPLDLSAELSELTDYRIINELGRGGMGVVYLAEHTLTGRKEVLKVLNERLMSHTEARKRFEQEVKCIASVDHDAIVRCYTVRMMPRTIVLAMEHIPGSDLHKFITRNGRLPIYVACVTDPMGPSTGSLRVRRGGSWFDYAKRCRSAFRSTRALGGRSNILGFRVAVDVVKG